ncbi:hypothetical protein J6590_072748 [Homalodisca vitripennis]|nr:hypothetical protein J6590_072748 [Homalodisca vitripennis]
MKRSYRKQLLRRLLLAEKNEESVIEFIKKVNLKDCIYILDDAWESLTETNLQRTWRKLWPYEDEKVTTQNMRQKKQGQLILKRLLQRRL